MMDINYELYKVFYHVATTLNFSEASKQLFISHTSFLRQFDTKLNILITIYFANSKFMSNFAS